MSQEFTLERQVRIYDDGDGSYVSISTDADSLGLVEIRYAENEKTIARITMHPKQAALMRNGLDEYLRLTHPDIYASLVAG